MSTTPLGQRQNLQFRAIAPGTSHTFTVDREHRIDRILFNPKGNPSAPTVRIQAEGELLFNGQAVSIQSIAIQTDDATSGATAQKGSPYVLRFDRLLTLSREFPITVEVVGGAVTVDVVLMGP